MPNRLSQETSPYLQQHADNPVDWYPWSEEAFERARREGKPILLSVGYSACHWCHVMAHESFEDAEIAGKMNRLFINVKVDREERPDVDQIYQTAHHVLTQRAGGWPLTMFLTPDQKPFYGGTYFPKSARYNLPGFGELLEKIAEVYRQQSEAIQAQNEELLNLLAGTSPALADVPIEVHDGPAEQAIAELSRMFDGVHGGFGGAPKFPHPAELELCLNVGVGRDDEPTRQLALYSLRKMAEGGIYDQLGGGFSRYSVDGRWMIPHFEKMLYDNGPLLRLYADGWLVSGAPLFARVCEETAAWVIREMQSPEGGYYSSLDADSEHEEGKFYVWSRDEVARLLSPEEYEAAAAYFGLGRAANFEGSHWHLHIAQPMEQVAAAIGADEPRAAQFIRSAREKLLAARERRVRPGRDEKILTSWNALMIQGMARAGQVFGRDDWIESACRACDFVRGTLYASGRLLATYKDGRAHLNAYLDDHAFMLAALLQLMQARFREQDVAFARILADDLIERYEDRAGGGFFFTSIDHEALIHRPKPGPDNATPSGNGIAALALQRLGHLFGEPGYLEAAERTLRLFFPEVQRHASAFPSMCMALLEYTKPPATVVLQGPRSGVEDWRKALASIYRPSTLIVAPAGAADSLPEAMNKPARPGVNAWVCRGVSCLPPIDEPGALEAELAVSR